jgi:hypothetical protein
MDFCNQYLVGDGGMLLDMPFMPRIVEGEVRILLVGPDPVFGVHKKPAEEQDAFSAPLFSGAKYRYDENDEDKYVLGEINCSCVGFTSHLDKGIQDQVADQVITVIEGHDA